MCVVCICTHNNNKLSLPRPHPRYSRCGSPWECSRLHSANPAGRAVGICRIFWLVVGLVLLFLSKRWKHQQMVRCRAWAFSRTLLQSRGGGCGVYLGWPSWVLSLTSHCAGRAGVGRWGQLIKKSRNGPGFSNHNHHGLLIRLKSPVKQPGKVFNCSKLSAQSTRTCSSHVVCRTSPTDLSILLLTYLLTYTHTSAYFLCCHVCALH